MKRRILLTSILGAVLPMQAALGKDRRLGLTIASYSHRWKGKYSHVKVPPFKDALDVLDHIRGLGFGALQIGMEGWTMDFAKQVRQTCESYDMALEGSIKLPVNESDVGRFERELRVGHEAGARIFRSAVGGRRYEIFTRRGDFEAWKVGALKALALAEPVAKKLKVKIGIENHKDWELQELVAALKAVSSEYMGACIDTGNSLALLEDPLTVIETLAPYVVTVHLKDLAVHEVKEGFQMSEVPLGQGRLDLEAMAALLMKDRPWLNLNLEMMTRDPLEIPCLTEGYWATFPGKPGVDMARTMTWVRQHDSALPTIRGLAVPTLLNLEEENIRQCLRFASSKLGFNHPSAQGGDAIKDR